MTYNIRLQIPKMKFFHSRSIILMACTLTFLYLIEFCIGIRTVFYVFELFKRSRKTSFISDDISWTVVVVSLLFCIVTCATVNCISAFWDSKPTTGIRSTLYYCSHILTGGILWRYVGLWKCDDLPSEREKAMLLTSLKFLFTQTYTVPLVVLHIYVHQELYELLYDLLMVVCISATLVLTCAVFHEYKECGKYPHETMALVPLLFQRVPSKEEERESGKASESVPEKNSPQNELLWRCVVATQTFCFSLGRILALGVLLKLAGIYAVTIILLQFLLSVLYLKFQASHLVPESLAKPKQVMRLTFLSYILIFEWQLHRDTSTGYNLKMGTRHGVLYYSIVTVESTFYLIVWAVTSSKSYVSSFDEKEIFYNEFLPLATSAGCLCLVFSYAIQTGVLLFKECRKREDFSSRNSWLRGLCSNPLKGNEAAVKRETPKIEITSVVNGGNVTSPRKAEGSCSTAEEVEEYNASYCDLRESIDYDNTTVKSIRYFLTGRKPFKRQAENTEHKLDGLKVTPANNSNEISGKDQNLNPCSIKSKNSTTEVRSQVQLQTAAAQIQINKEDSFVAKEETNEGLSGSGKSTDKETACSEETKCIRNESLQKTIAESQTHEITEQVRNLTSYLSSKLGKFAHLNFNKNSKKTGNPSESRENCNGEIRIPTIMTEYEKEFRGDGFENVATSHTEQSYPGYILPGKGASAGEIIESGMKQPVPHPRSRRIRQRKLSEENCEEEARKSAGSSHCNEIVIDATEEENKRSLLVSKEDGKVSATEEENEGRNVERAFCREVSMSRCEEGVEVEEDIIYELSACQSVQKKNNLSSEGLKKGNCEFVFHSSAEFQQEVEHFI